MAESFRDYCIGRGLSRRAFLRACAGLALAMGLPDGQRRAFAEGLAASFRPPLVWLSFQECTGCTESLTRSDAPDLATLIFDFISLDYHHTLQAAAGFQAEAAKERTIKDFAGRYLLVVDGSLPGPGGEGYSTTAGVANLASLKEAAAGAAAVIAVGSCAAFGGLPVAAPNPTGAVSVSQALGVPVVNIPGCPPLPFAITGVVAHFLAFGHLPELDRLGRPRLFYGNTIHDRCYRRSFYDQGLFAESFDDEGARAGWCLYKLGCKGPTTHNACATLKWNGGTSFPIESGHGCLGCSEPDFWDAGGFYDPLSVPLRNDAVLAGLAAGAVVGGAAAIAVKKVREAARKARRPVGLDDLGEGE